MLSTWRFRIKLQVLLGVGQTVVGVDFGRPHCLKVLNAAAASPTLLLKGTWYLSLFDTPFQLCQQYTTVLESGSCRSHVFSVCYWV